MNRSKIIGITAMGLILIAVLVYGFRPQPVLVDSAQLTRKPLQVTVDEEGKTRVKDRFIVSTPVAGYARRIAMDVGDTIVAGQELLIVEPLRAAVFDPRTRAEAMERIDVAEASLKVAQENTQAMQASADLAQLELERVKKLRATQHATQDEEDRASAEVRRTTAGLRSAHFAVEVARHQIHAARTAFEYGKSQANGEKLEKLSVISPISGQVLKLYRESEGVVEAGQALIEVGNPRALEVEIDVLSADAVQIKPGTHVIFERWGGDHPLDGRVRLIEPVGFTKISSLGVEEQRVLVIADITSPPDDWERLGDSYRVEARFILWADDDVLQIPASALFRYQNSWAVFTIDNGRAHRRVVEIGKRNGLQAEVLSGLDEAATVIIHPSEKVEDGVRVVLR